jgi:hypothetical protein
MAQDALPSALPFVSVRRLAAILLLVALATSLARARADQGNGRLDSEVLKKVKRATVLLHVTLADGSEVSGSGFFGNIRGLVMTNAHVLGMLRPESRKPRKVEVVINSGQQGERTLPGQVVGVDPDSDLGLILVRGNDLPEPLKLDENKPLQETDPLFIFGFPFGSDLGKNVTVSQSSVSSLRMNASGKALEKIQVNGGMHPGNSGGPVIVPSGEVVGIAVSGIKNSTINFAVPARSAAYFLIGRGRLYGFDTPYKDGDKIRVPVRVEMVDPLHRVRQICYETWIGDPAKSRESKPDQMLPGDSQHEKVTLTYANGVAQGELVYPVPPPAGKVYWRQFSYSSGNDKRVWGGPIIYRPLPPVERKPVLLKHQEPSAHSTWKLVSTATIKLRDEDDVDHTLALKLTGDLDAATADKAEKGLTVTNLKLSRLELAMTLDKKPLADTKEDADLAKQLQLFSAQLREKADGGFASTSLNLRQLPRKSQELWRMIGDQITASLEDVSFARPAGEVEFGKPWKGTQPLAVYTLGQTQRAVGDVENEYIGVRTRRGREEAIVRTKGDVHGKAGAGSDPAGHSRGETWIDVATGQAIMSRNTIDVDLEIMLGKKRAKAGGTLEVVLDRVLPNKEKVQ